MIARATLIALVFCFLTACGGSGGSSSGSGGNGNAPTLIWDQGNWDNSNWG